MIDQFFENIAEQINYVLLPGIDQVMYDLMHNNILKNMTADEIRVASLKYFLEAMTILVLVLIGSKIRNKIRSKKRIVKKKANTKTPKIKWTPDGWYWDEKKQSWIGPDFPQNEK